MATNMYKKYTEGKTREWAVPEGTQAGDLVIHEVSGQVGVALTARGDSTAPAGIPGVAGTGTPSGTVVYQGSDAQTVALEGETAVGVVDDGAIIGGRGPILIGAVL